MGHTQAMQSFIPPSFDFLPFQVEMLESIIDQRYIVLGADTGMGKSVMAIFNMCWRIDNKQIDHIILEVEKNKFTEWQKDLAQYSTLTVGCLDGAPAARKKVIASKPQVILGVYETIRNEAAVKTPVKVGKRMVRRWVPGALVELYKNSRVLLVQDEGTAKIGANRSSAMYKTHEIMMKTFHAKGYVLGLTATYMNRDPLGWWNYARLLDPKSCGTVKSFEDNHVIRDRFENPIKFINLENDKCSFGVKSLRSKTGHLLIAKRKSDPDVIHLFPEIQTRVEYIKMNPDQENFYQAVLKAAKKNTDPFKAGAYFSALRQIAGHPESLIRSVDNAHAEKRDAPMVASEILKKLTRLQIINIDSTKLDRLVEIIKANPKNQFVVFTFYGRSILPIIQERLERENIKTVINHGGLSHKARADAQSEFRNNKATVFLTSDAGARGINLPTAGIVINYELPLTYSIWWQRINRANRLDSKLPTTTVIDLIVDNTVEEGIVEIGLKRHAWSDVLLPDSEDGTEYLSAETRKEILAFAKEK